MTSTLHLVSTPIGNLGDLSPRAVDTLQRSALICCEDTRHSGKLLSHAGVSGVRLAVCNEHNEASCALDVIAVLTAGRDVALVTDAGTPGISDPGTRLVQAVLDAGFAVSAVPGPAALVMALVVSGFSTTRFVFEAFLPRSGAERSHRLDEISHERRTVVLYEAPHRIARTVSDLAAACGGARHVALARELTKLHEDTWRGPLADAVGHVAATAPRGEYVIVIDGAHPPDAADDATLVAALQSALANGQTRKDAVATVMHDFAVPKRRVYDLALTLPR